MYAKTQLAALNMHAGRKKTQLSACVGQSVERDTAQCERERSFAPDRLAGCKHFPKKKRNLATTSYVPAGDVLGEHQHGLA
jgi:hypothetical protein